MKNYEFNNWIASVKEAFPKFNPTGEIQLAGWKAALGDATLDEAKAALVRYVAEVSSRYEPQPKDISGILEAVKKQRIKPEEFGEAKPDCPLARMKRDIELGTCRHNLYHYQRALKLLNRREVADFDEGLRESCRRMCGRDYEFPSKNDLAKNGLDKAKVKPAEVKYLFESFARRFSVG